MKKILCLILIAIVYRATFINPEFIGGDWPYYFKEYLSSFTLPSIWNPLWSTGLGGNQAIILPLKLYLHLVVTIFVNSLGIPWPFIQKIFFFWLFLILSIYSSYKLTKSWIGVLIYTTNTWILLVLSGGQIGIALAYAIAPLVIRTFINLIENTKFTSKNFQFQISNFKFPMLAGLVFATQVIFDIRVAFLTILVVLGYTIFHHFFIERIKFKPLAICYLLLALITILLHAFWILPGIFVALKGGNVASIVDTSSGSLEFLSFAKFENSLSLLHPNWPENIFGKVAFMRPEFLIIPILAFSSLLFIKNNTTIKQYSNIIPFFTLIGLTGAFLAKGTQEPFGLVFSWLYSNIPGFNLFRDPVKFYILVAVSYSLLVPYSLGQLGKLKKILSIAFILFWAYLSLPFILQLDVGVFKQRSVPADYIRLKEFLVSKPDFFRTLWVPSVQRFGFMSETHPTLSFQDLFQSNFVLEFGKSEFQSLLSDLSVKYVIVAYDSEGEIFLNDRKYDDELYRKIIIEFNKIPWLKRVEGFGKIIVYELSTTKPHFYLEKDSKIISFKRRSSTEYFVNVQTQNASRLIFSEQFDQGWVAEDNGNQYRVSSIRYKKYLNSFPLPMSGKYNLRIYYKPQKVANIGYLVSGLTMLSVVGVIGTSLRRK